MAGTTSSMQPGTGIATERSPVTLVRHLTSAFRDWSERRRAAAALAAMTDRELRDIGLTRGAIDWAVWGPVQQRRPTVDEYLAGVNERGKPTRSRWYRSA